MKRSIHVGHNALLSDDELAHVNGGTRVSPGAFGAPSLLSKLASFASRFPGLSVLARYAPKVDRGVGGYGVK